MGSVQRIYVDTCLIIAYFHANDPNNQHQRAIEFFNRMDGVNNIELYCSTFTITEFTQAFVTLPRRTDEKAYEIANSLLLSGKIDRKHSFTLLKAEGKERKYAIKDLFLDVQTILLNTRPRPGIADAIHATIMKNNKITEIVTFNTSDFSNMDDITPLEPETIFANNM